MTKKARKKKPREPPSLHTSRLSSLVSLCVSVSSPLPKQTHLEKQKWNLHYCQNDIYIIIIIIIIFILYMFYVSNPPS